MLASSWSQSHLGLGPRVHPRLSCTGLTLRASPADILGVGVMVWRVKLKKQMQAMAQPWEGRVPEGGEAQVAWGCSGKGLQQEQGSPGGARQHSPAEVRPARHSVCGSCLDLPATKHRRLAQHMSVSSWNQLFSRRFLYLLNYKVLTWGLICESQSPPNLWGSAFCGLVLSLSCNP